MSQSKNMQRDYLNWSRKAKNVLLKSTVNTVFREPQRKKILGGK